MCFKKIIEWFKWNFFGGKQADKELVKKTYAAKLKVQQLQDEASDDFVKVRFPKPKFWIRKSGKRKGLKIYPLRCIDCKKRSQTPNIKIAKRLYVCKACRTTGRKKQ